MTWLQLFSILLTKMIKKKGSNQRTLSFELEFSLTIFCQLFSRVPLARLTYQLVDFLNCDKWWFSCEYKANLSRYVQTWQSLATKL